MKRFFLLFMIIAGLLGFTACEEFLGEELTAEVSSETYYTTPAGLEDAVKATYETMKTFWGQERGMTLTVFGTDEYTNGADGNFKGINVYDSRLNAQDPFIRDTWRDFYRGINQANAVVSRADGIAMDEKIKQQRVAEARFLRALYYFTLVQMYGPVHLSLEETVGVEIESNRTPVAEIYSEAIIPDLEFAVANLAAPAQQKDYGRAHKAAAEFLLAKVHLTRGYSGAAQSNDFQKAFDYMKSVIENYNYKLLEDFGAVWNHDAELHSEVVWSIQNTQDAILNGNGNRAHLYFLMEYDVLPGMTRDITNGRPFKRFKPTEFLIGLWNRDLDVRYDRSFKHVFFSNNAANIPKGPNGVPKFTVGDTAIYLPGVEWSAEQIAASRYLVITPSKYTEKLYPTLLKFLDGKRSDRQLEQGSRDFMLMRLADAYLIAAEALFKMGRLQDAADYINVVRTRAARPGRQADMRIGADQVTLDFILDERARELVGETHRWFDLVRTGKLVERVRLYNKQAAPNIKDHHVLRPIPQDQIDKTTSDYPQNPGY